VTATLDSVVPRDGGPRRGPAHWPVRIGLVLLATAVLALPFFAATEYYENQKYMSPQAAVVADHLDAAETASWSGSAKQLPATDAPVVLTYHDISPVSSSPYVVTPKAFDAQLTALQKAGYRTLTADEFAAYLRGGPAPPRSVLLTFDDGTNGLWTYADRILAKHQMHATSFLITGRVNDRPYYLSWNEIKRMQASGRWDFQDHTHDSHRREPVDAAGHLGSMLANRLWLPAQNRLETVAEYDARVDGDLNQSFQDFADHGLPKPLFFAFPFSEAIDRANVNAPGIQNLLQQHFLATMTDVSSRPLTASRRAAAAHSVLRLEVTDTTTPAQLLTQVAAWLQVPPSAADPLGQKAMWARSDHSKVAGVGPFTGKGPYPAGSRYAATEYRPNNSLDWTDYQVEARLDHLGDGTNQGAVTVRVDSAEPVTASVSQGTLSLLVDDRKVASRKLGAVAGHVLRVVVEGRTTTVTVDSTAKLSWTSKIAPSELTGGIGIRVGINKAGDEWPAFTSLRVAPTQDSAAASGKNEQKVSASVLLDPNATWLSAPGEKAPFHINRNGIEPKLGQSLSVYGAYQPDRTSDWTDYTLKGTVSRLTRDGVSGAVWVRVGSPLAISVQVSRSQLQVFSGDAGDGQALVGQRPLTPASTHQVTVTVSDSSTVVSVDGVVRMTLIAKGETGGVAFSAYRGLTRWSWPTLTGVAVEPGVDG
jgi:biofilm PGA synthesis lipoprotein PgaB